MVSLNRELLGLEMIKTRSVEEGPVKRGKSYNFENIILVSSNSLAFSTEREESKSYILF